MAWKFSDMELSDDEKLDGHLPAINHTPDYPYGLKLCLTRAELQRLGIPEDDMPESGDMLHFAAMANVTNVSTNDGEMGKDCRIELQITHMALENESTEFGGNK